MGIPIVKIKDHYLLWSSYSDSPGSYGMPLDKFKSFYKKEKIKEIMKDLEERLERVEENGHSVLNGESLKEFLSTNRAGKNEKKLTIDELYKVYCLRENLNGWKPF